MQKITHLAENEGSKLQQVQDHGFKHLGSYYKMEIESSQTVAAQFLVFGQLFVKYHN